MPPPLSREVQNPDDCGLRCFLRRLPCHNPQGPVGYPTTGSAYLVVPPAARLLSLAPSHTRTHTQPGLRLAAQGSNALLQTCQTARAQESQPLRQWLVVSPSLSLHLLPHLPSKQPLAHQRCHWHTAPWVPSAWNPCRRQLRRQRRRLSQLLAPRSVAVRGRGQLPLAPSASSPACSRRRPTPSSFGGPSKCWRSKMAR